MSKFKTNIFLIKTTSNYLWADKNWAHFQKIQGPSTQIDAFHTNIFSWLDDIMIKKKIFLKSWDREIWYKTFILGITTFSWSQSLNIWKIQRVVFLIFADIFKWKWKQKQCSLLPLINFWQNQRLYRKNFISFLSEVVEAMWGWWSKKIMFYIKSPYLRIPKIIDFWIQCH